MFMIFGNLQLVGKCDSTALIIKKFILASWFLKIHVANKFTT